MSDQRDPQSGAAPQRSAPTDSLGSDSLAAGVVLLLSLAVVQRIVGFARSVLFCRWLPPEQLGQWDLAFSFLMLAAPLTVLGLSGSFGRYIEHFRHRGQLRPFLRRTTAAMAALAVVGVGVLLLRPDWFSRLIFDSPEYTRLLLMLAGVLVVMVVFNYLVELFTALRQARVVSGMQFGNSLMFAIFGGVLISTWRSQAAAVVAAFGLATLCTSLIGLWHLRGAWRLIPEPNEALGHRPLWAKVVPYAGWLWGTNVMANLFEVADRYMIVHFGRMESTEALAVVGNYHSSRIVPLLMVAVSTLIGGWMLPHLSHDWERGRRREVSDRLNLAVKLWGLTLVAGAVAVLVASPLIFGWAFAGKYDGGLAVLPWTLTYCVWSGIGLLAANYLWCVEKARLTCLVYLCGLVVNVALNIQLLPRMGLLGAVLATSAGHLIALTLILALSRMSGMRIDRAVVPIVLLPLTISLGPALATLVLLAVAVLLIRTDWILSGPEKQQLAELAAPIAARLPVVGRMIRFVGAEAPSAS